MPLFISDELTACQDDGISWADNWVATLMIQVLNCLTSAARRVSSTDDSYG